MSVGLKIGDGIFSRLPKNFFSLAQVFTPGLRVGMA